MYLYIFLSKTNLSIFECFLDNSIYELIIFPLEHEYDYDFKAQGK